MAGEDSSESTPIPQNIIRIRKSKFFQSNIDEGLDTYSRKGVSDPTAFLPEIRSKIAVDAALKRSRRDVARKNQEIETAKKQTEAAEAQSLVDRKTGLYNDRWFEQQLTTLIAAREREARDQVTENNENGWIVFFDLDRFKTTN